MQHCVNDANDKCGVPKFSVYDYYNIQTVYPSIWLWNQLNKAMPVSIHWTQSIIDLLLCC